jgi:hypothetical protein
MADNTQVICMIYGLIADFKAGGSTNHTTATDGSIVYYADVDGKT